jgi:cobalt-zinc-cadmium efflux system outer membrane protein
MGRAVVQAAIRTASDGFFRALHADGQARLALESEEVTRRFKSAAQKLNDAGLGSSLELELADLEEAEAAQNSVAMRAAATRWRAELLALVGLPPEAFNGLFGTLRPDAPIPVLALALERLQDRPDILAFTAEREAAFREARVAASEAIPTPVLGASYQYQHQNPAAQHMVLAQVTFPLPVFSRGQGEEGRARGRARGLADQEHQALLNAQAEVRAAHALLTEIQSARAPWHREAADSASFTEKLERAYAQRTVDLGTVLNMQRRLIAGRRAALDLDLQEALARVWLDAAMGVLQ